MIFGSSFADKRASASSIEIGIDNSVKRLGKFKIHFHSPRGAAQAGRRPVKYTKLNNLLVRRDFLPFKLEVKSYGGRPVGADDVCEVVQFRDDAIESSLERYAIALVLDVDSALSVVGLGQNTGDPTLRVERDGENHAPHSH